MLLFLPMAMAHGGESFEKEVGKRLIDIGYDIPLTQNQETLLDIALYDMQSDGSDELLKCTSVTLTLASGSTVLLKHTVQAPTFGKTFTTVRPEKYGNFTLSVEFFQDDILLERASFDIVIRESEARPSRGALHTVMIIFVVAAFLLSIFIIMKKNRFF